MWNHERRSSDGCWRWVIVCAAACLTAGWPPTSAARAVACGDTIVEDFTLETDLTCAGPGLIVGADGIRVNLNGHTIDGPHSGTSIGLELAGRTNVSVIGGRVTGFFAGIRTLNASDIDIRGNLLEHNNDGVDVAAGSERIVIKDNAFADNRARGVMLRGDTADCEVKSNMFTRNNVGILLFGTLRAEVKENTISESRLNGIRLGVLTRDNVIAQNAIASHPAGIEFVAGTSPSIGNRLLENLLSTNACGLKGPLAGNTINDTTFQSNTVDVCG